ncbi:MAG: hypothetical protein ACR2NM_10685, partial [Bythopirellula sp.]
MHRRVGCWMLCASLCQWWASAAEPVALQAPAGASAQEYDWPGFLGPQRNGKSAEVGLPAEWPAGGPALVW